MALFGDLSKKITVTSQTMVHKAKGMADITGMKSQIADEQKKIEKYYQNLGKLYYDLKRDEPLPELQELVAMIKSSYYKTCPVCGTPLDDDTIFCVGCGTRIENQNAPVQNNAVPESKFCISCGSKIPGAAAFCTKCGAKQS